MPESSGPQQRNQRRAGFGTALTAEEQQATAPTPSNAERKAADEMQAMKASLLDDVFTMVEYSEAKISSFKHSVRAYKNNEAPARDMVDTVYSILNRDTDDTTKIVKRIADTFKGDDEKIEGIFKALEAFKVDVSDASQKTKQDLWAMAAKFFVLLQIQRRNEFPSLGGSGGNSGTSTPPLTAGTGYSGIASGRVLNAKRMTQPTGSSASKLFDRVERAATSVGPVLKPKTTTTAASSATKNSQGQVVPGAAFPSLRPASSSTRATYVSEPTTSNYSSVAQPMIRSVQSSSSSSSRGGPRVSSKAAFPSLPASNPSMNNSKGQTFKRDELVRRMKGESAYASENGGWQSPVTPSPGEHPGANSHEVDYALDEALARSLAEENSGAAAGGGKKKKKGKEVLFTLGQARP